MRESDRNLDIPPGHTPGNFDGLLRSNALHIFVIPVQIHHVLCKIGVQIPHPMYELEATAFRNFGITKFFFPSETLFNRSKPFSCSQPRTKLISSHLNSSIVIDAILDSAHVFKRKIQIPDPKQIPHLPLEKSSNSRLLQILNKQIPQVCPGGMSRFRFESRINEYNLT